MTADVTTRDDERATRDDGRAALAAALAARDVPAARAAVRLLSREGSIPQLRVVRRALADAAAVRAELRPLRVALLASFSIEFLHDALVTFGFADGLDVEIYQPGFRQFAQQIADPGSGLYAFRPDVVVLALEGPDVVPALYRLDGQPTDPEVIRAVADAGAEIAQLVATFRERSAATLLVHGFAPPVWPSLGILDGHLAAGQLQHVEALNEGLRAVARRVAATYVVDYAGVVARVGAASWYDDRMALYAAAPIQQRQLAELAREYLKFFRALTGKAKKCLVVDLDNTLWGGVLGEEGPDGIQLGPKYPGNAYVKFQEALLGLQRRGVILALASRNNPQEVHDLFARHPHMVLRREHFACEQIHWNAKSGSIAAIARQLNIGLEHIVFADDNHAECAQVAAALPDVTVVPLPAEPERFVAALLRDGLFETLGVSDEDRRRGELYQQRDQAEALREGSASLEDFYERLAMEVVFAPVRPGTLTRAAQLTQKTNQYTTTTVRYSEADVRQRGEDPAWLVTTVQVRDRFGDNGIVGLAMAKAAGDEVLVDTFLLSCRVIGRTVETAMLAHLCEWARGRRARRLRGRIVPTPKNVPVRGLYESHGFKHASEDANGIEWTLDLASDVLTSPPWLTIVHEAGA